MYMSLRVHVFATIYMRQRACMYKMKSILTVFVCVPVRQPHGLPNLLVAVAMRI